MFKIKKFSDGDLGLEEWLNYRKGKITGTRLKDIVIKRGTKQKAGFFEIIAERVALPPTEENRMDRGHRLEDEATKRFEKETGKKVDSSLIMWQREDYSDIAISPDGMIGKTEALEIKCLNSAKHIEAWYYKKIPSDYDEQVIQYFVVNDSLKTLYFVLYDPRMPKDYLQFQVNRKDKGVEEQIAYLLQYQIDTLAEIEKITSQLTF